jgi:hypothetical protein
MEQNAGIDRGLVDLVDLVDGFYQWFQRRIRFENFDACGVWME